MSNYIKYARAFDASDKVVHWINHNLKNYLDKNQENQEEIEHIIDFLVSDAAPVKMDMMSYPEAKKATEKWVKKLNKKAGKIVEEPEDTEVVYDFEDGFKIVKLVGKRAYEREGYLMRHCVASYYGSDKTIYSLRDSKNNPHCTMEEDQQVKGKGNGDIHPKYVGYVVKFLEHTGMTVGDSEMAHLGYINVKKIKHHLHKDTSYFNEVYLPENEKLIDKNGDEFASFDLLDIKPLIKKQNNEIKINFDLQSFIEMSFDFLWKNSEKKEISSGDSSKAASCGYLSTAASCGYSSMASVSGRESIAAAIGVDTRASASLGSWIVLSEYYSDGDEIKVKTVKAAKIDGKKLKEDTFYKLENEEFVEVKE